MTSDLSVVRQGTSMLPSPSPSPGSPGTPATLGTVDIVVLVVYFVLILAVGLWVRLNYLCQKQMRTTLPFKNPT